jgi:PAS domain S-box-containing protein
MTQSYIRTFDALAAKLLSPISTLESLREGVTISDPNQKDNPLVYANDSFLRLTGYSLKEVIHRNCRFLQGPQTNPQDLEYIRQALRAGTPHTVELLNYRKDGTPFWNRLTISPIRNDAGVTTHFIAIQRDVTEYHEQQQKLLEKSASLASLEEALKMLRSRVKEQEETIAAFIMHTDPALHRS